MSDSGIVTLGPGDCDLLLDLWRAAGLSHRPSGRDSREAILAQMGMPQCRFLGLRGRSGLLLGAVLATHEGRKGWINRLAVRPDARRSRLAARLVAACEEWLFGQGILIVAALVEGDNAPSQSLFSASGYERDDTLVYFRKLAAPEV